MKAKAKLFDKTIEASTPVQLLAAAVKSLAEQLGVLAAEVGTIAYNQAVHHHMIIQMWQRQQAILQRMQQSSLDTRLPKLEAKKDADKNDKDKPN